MTRAIPAHSHLSLAPRLSLEQFLSRALVTGLLCILPLFFGGAHPRVYLSVYAICFLYAASFANKTISGETASTSDTAGKSLLLILGTFSIYTFLYGVINLFLNDSHPILGSVPTLYAPEHYFLSWFGFTAGLAIFYTTIRLLETKLISSEFIMRSIALSGLLISLISLSHWFYDNGRLFWIFEPDHIFVSERARWPYVSANNLGHHLILTLYPTLYLLIRGVRSIFSTIDTISARRPLNALDLINTPGVQLKFLKIVVDLFALLSISLALLASQSRGSWIGSCAGVILFLCLDRIMHKKLSVSSATSATETFRDRKRKNRALEGVTFFDTIIFILRKVSFLAGMSIALLLLALFLREKGLDLVTNRAEYGLLASKDDIRWVMYDNTLAMVRDFPFFGVGLGSWNTLIGRYIDPSLARLNPVFLHSDPLQMLAETGIFGALFLLAAAFLVFRDSVLTLMGSNNRYSLALLSLFCSLLALTISSFFDFPFRLPSISSLFMIEMGLFCFIFSSNRSNNQTSIE